MDRSNNTGEFEEFGALAHSLLEIQRRDVKLGHFSPLPMPALEIVGEIVDRLQAVLFPNMSPSLERGNDAFLNRLQDNLSWLGPKLSEQIAWALATDSLAETNGPEKLSETAKELAVGFLNELPKIAEILSQDVDAAFQGDPAAKTHNEIVYCYPGIQAVSIYRLAHALHEKGVPLIPRALCEIGHARTGIDIHPGAKIGPGFFIDHGTGVVIGETCVIGKNVKLYQGVTLGALSFARDESGALIRGQKRHPTIEDHVVIYANATILGGGTVIGHNSIIGSSAWVNHTIAAYSVVTIEKPVLKLFGPGVKMALDYQI